MTERPWWASGAGGLGEDDPERAHRAGRRGEFDPLGDAARRFAEHVADWSADHAAPPDDDDADPGGDPGTDTSADAATVDEEIVPTSRISPRPSTAPSTCAASGKGC